MYHHRTSTAHPTAFIILAVISLTLSPGCYSTSYTKGHYLRTDRVPGTEEIIRWTLQGSVITEPDPENPVITLRINKVPYQRVATVEKYTRIQKKEPIAKDAKEVEVLGLLMGVIGMAIGFEGIANDDDLQLVLGLLIEILAFIPVYGADGIIYRLEAGASSQVAGTIDGETGHAFKLGVPNVLLNERIIIRTRRGTTSNYITDSSGAITIDLVNDLGLGTFQSPDPIDFAFANSDTTLIGSFSLSPRDWTVPQIQILGQGHWVRSEPNSNSKRLGKLETSEIHQLTERKSGGWEEIVYNGQKSWVYKPQGSRFWAPLTYFDPIRPPVLSAILEFAEASGNGYLDGDEAGELRLIVKNEGKGLAHRVQYKISPKSINHLSFNPEEVIGDISAGKIHIHTIPIKAAKDIASQKVSMNITFIEANGFEPPPVKLTFSTREFVPPVLTIADVGVDDASRNRIIEQGEVADITARIQNIGNGPARDVQAAVHTGSNVFLTNDSQTQFTLGTLEPGEFGDIFFTIYTNRRATGLPIYVDLTEHYGLYGKSGIDLPLAFNLPTHEIEELIVEGIESIPPGFEDDSRLSVDVDVDIPKTQMHNPDAVAVVIGISDYQYAGVPKVEYAKRDAAVMRQYLIEVLGYDKSNILPRDPGRVMTAGTMKTLIRQELPGYIKHGKSDVFVYFSGHGAPNISNRQAYLVPSDCDPNFVNDDNAYSLTEFYEDLSRLKSKNTTVVLDACFSGISGGGEMLIRQASPIYISVENPLLAKRNAIVFAAASADQVSNWYPEKRHGMFTYFFLKGLQGAADLNNNKVLTVGELQSYLTDEDDGVPYWSRREFQRPQMPQVTATQKDYVLVRY